MANWMAVFLFGAATGMFAILLVAPNPPAISVADYPLNYETMEAIISVFIGISVAMLFFWYYA